MSTTNGPGAKGPAPKAGKPRGKNPYPNLVRAKLKEDKATPRRRTKATADAHKARKGRDWI